MKYELAIELKKAGFPMKQVGETKHNDYWFGRDTQQTFALPTLSELIEEIPKRVKYLDGLVNDAIFTLQKMWCTSGKNYRAYLDGDFESSDIAEKWSFNSDTPEEAVARLWLALKKI